MHVFRHDIIEEDESEKEYHKKKWWNNMEDKMSKKLDMVTKDKKEDNQIGGQNLLPAPQDSARNYLIIFK